MEKTETATEEDKGAMALLIDGAVLIQQKQYVSLQYISTGDFFADKFIQGGVSWLNSRSMIARRPNLPTI